MVDVGFVDSLDELGMHRSYISEKVKIVHDEAKGKCFVAVLSAQNSGDLVIECSRTELLDLAKLIIRTLDPTTEDEILACLREIKSRLDPKEGESK